MLDSTLVVVTSEFGRTPKVNAGGGRDHWPRVFSIVMAGGGIKRGQVYGASDGLAAEPARTIRSRSRTTPRRSTTCSASTPARHLMSPGDRPQPIVDDGKVVRGLLA